MAGFTPLRNSQGSPLPPTAENWAMLPFSVTQYCVTPCPVPEEKVKAQVSLAGCTLAVPDSVGFCWAIATQENPSTASSEIDSLSIFNTPLTRDFTRVV